MLIRERTRALSPNLRARTTATTCMSAARPCSSQGTVREVNSSSTWLAHFVTRQECEEHDLRTRSTRRKPRSDLSGHGGPKCRRGRVSRNAAPTVAYYLECRFGKMKCEAAELRASWDELQLWWLRSSAVATLAMAKAAAGAVAAAGWGQDGVSKMDERFGQRSWLIFMAGRERRKWRMSTSARRPSMYGRHIFAVGWGQWAVACAAAARSKREREASGVLVRNEATSPSL